MPTINAIGHNECTGCGACVSACPLQCIHFEYDDEGFLYPYVGNECMECGLCAEICPILSGKTERTSCFEQYAVAAVSHNRSTCCASTSGGAFTEICQAYGDHDTVIFGARFDGLRVAHAHVIGVENIAPFRKSKYVQSDIGMCLMEAKAFLDEGRRVIFSGTPCQIAGLKSFLGKDYDHLLCIDLICHGVGSPKVFQSALNHIEKRAGAKLVGYSFRNQIVRCGNHRDFISCYEFIDGRRIYNDRDIYQAFYLSQLCLRSSCGKNCRFRNPNRLSDLTIADYKEKYIVFPNLMDHRNYSTIIINNTRGDAVFRSLSGRMKILPCRMSDIEKFNPLFFHTTPDNPERERFFSLFREGVGYEDLASRFSLSCLPQRKYGWLKDHLMPFYLRRAIRIFLNRYSIIRACIKRNITSRTRSAARYHD